MNLRKRVKAYLNMESLFPLRVHLARLGISECAQGILLYAIYYLSAFLPPTVYNPQPLSPPPGSLVFLSHEFSCHSCLDALAHAAPFLAGIFLPYSSIRIEAQIKSPLSLKTFLPTPAFSIICSSQLPSVSLFKDSLVH